MSSSMWRKLIAAPFLFFAIVLFWQESSSYLLSKTVHHSEQIGPTTTIDYHITDIAITPGECADLTWDAEGIQAIYLSDVGTIGQGKQTFCGQTNGQTYPIKLTVIDQSGEEHIYNEAIQVQAFQPFQPATVILVIGLLIAAAPKPYVKPRALSRLAPVLIIPMGLMGAAALLLLVDQILTSPGVIDFVTHATYDVVATDPDRCGFDHFSYEAAPFSTQPERLLFQDIPGTQQGEGKIIITGVSNASESFLWPELPPELQNKLLNLAVGAASSVENGALIDYLQREKQTLTPTTGKSAVMLLYWNAIFAVREKNRSYDKLFMKYDKLNVDTSSSIRWRLTPTYNPTSHLQIAYERVTTMLFEHLPRALEATFQPSVDIVDQGSLCYPHGYPHKDRFIGDMNFWTNYYGGPDHYVLPNIRTQGLEAMAEDIQKTGTPLILVHLPVSHWFQDMVYQERYLSYMKAFSEKYNVPIYDLSQFLSDDDFRDNIHLTITGRRKLQAKLLDILVQEGALSKQDIEQ